MPGLGRLAGKCAKVVGGACYNMYFGALIDMASKQGGALLGQVKMGTLGKILPVMSLTTTVTGYVNYDRPGSRKFYSTATGTSPRS